MPPNVAALIESGVDVEVRTKHGMWRLVIAVYSDGTLGTVRPESTSHGRFTILGAGQIVSVRQRLPNVVRPARGC
jgi:hypothetical protein